MIKADIIIETEDDYKEYHLESQTLELLIESIDKLDRHLKVKSESQENKITIDVK